MNRSRDQECQELGDMPEYLEDLDTYSRDKSISGVHRRPNLTKNCQEISRAVVREAISHQAMQESSFSTRRLPQRSVMDDRT